MDDEIWKPIAGYEGIYEVSNMGRVRSVDRVVTAKDPWGNTTDFHRKGIIMKPGPHPCGYKLVRLGKDQKSHTVHKLVAENFIGPRPEGMQIRHLDGSRNNNRADNLAYGSAIDNANDSKAHGTFQKRVRNNCKILPEQRRIIIQMYASGKHTMKEIGSMFGVTLGSIWWVIRRADATSSY